MNATDIRAARTAAVAATMSRVRAIEAAEGVSRASLAKIEVELRKLASQQHLFPSSEFPPPESGQKGANRYLLEEQPDHRFALYMNALNPGNETRPHDHTTWAVVVAVEGQEMNKIYRREPGRLVVDREVLVEPGRGIALMPDDIHSIHITGGVPTRHLHCYGLALEKLDNRMAYDATGTAIPYNRNFMRPTQAPRG